MLEINKIYHGDCRELFKQLEDESVDCIITSPPYWVLRDYGLEPLIWDGDEGCEHEWGNNETVKPSVQVDFSSSGLKNDGRTEERRIRTNTKSSGKRSNGAGSSQFCSPCGAWRGSLGLEPTFQLYIQHLMQIFNEVKRVLKKTGTCWVNLGDKHASGKGTCYNPGGGKNSFHKKRKEHGIYPLNRGNKSSLDRMGVQQKSLC